MKKALSLIIASAFLAAEPLLAAEAQNNIPKELSDMGITAEDLKDVGKAVVDEPTKAEMDIMQYYRHRYCPRGFRLIVYRVRVGRYIVTRYRCVRRYHYHDRYRDRYDRWYDSAPLDQQGDQPETNTPEK